MLWMCQVIYYQQITICAFGYIAQKKNVKTRVENYDECGDFYPLCEICQKFTFVIVQNNKQKIVWYFLGLKRVAKINFDL